MALVGPNEAGKHTLLDALEQLNTTDRFDPNDLSHEQQFEDDATILRARFLLEQSDRDAIGHLPGGGKARWFILAKRRGGQHATAIEPALELDLTLRRGLRPPRDCVQQRGDQACPQLSPVNLGPAWMVL